MVLPQKIILKNTQNGAQPVLVSSAHMSQLLAQQTQGNVANISLQQVEGAQALIALQQQHSIQQMEVLVLCILHFSILYYTRLHCAVLYFTVQFQS